VVGPDKANNTKPDYANLYRVELVQHWEPTEDDDGTVGKIEYVMQSDRTIRDWVSDKHDNTDNDDDLTELDKAVDWLRNYLLIEQPISHRDVKKDAEKAKIKTKTLRKAREQLKVVPQPVKGVTPYTTTWALP
jgi:hypothetical protein